MLSQQSLDESALRACLSSDAQTLLGELRVLNTVDSTNAELMRQPGLQGRARVCLAEQQSAGRGRRGRDWQSPPGSNIYISVSWSFAGGAQAMAGLSLAVGVILCDVLQESGAVDVALKWPNDVLRGGAKLAGTLIEVQGDANGPCQGVIGTGINVRMPPDIARDIDQPWADLSDLDPCRNTVAAALLSRLLPLLADFEATGFAPWRERWQARNAHAGQPVHILSSGPTLAGVATGVDESGALLLDTATGLRTIHAGEVSLRSQAG